MTIINLQDGQVRNVEQYDNASGKKKSVAKNPKKAGLGRLINDAQSAQRERRMIRVKSKADARVGRADAKNQEAIAKQLMADASKEGVKGDIALGNALAVSSPQLDTKEDKSPNYILWGAGGLLLVAVVGFAAYKMRK